MSTAPMIHEIYFHQTRNGKERSVCLLLNEPYRWTAISEAEGKWTHGKVLNYLGDDVHLYRNFPSSERSRLTWRWNSATFVIQVGAVNTSESHKDGKYTYFRNWISLHGAKRYADHRFYIESTPPNVTAPGRYELHGSSDTFEQGSGEWQLTRYSSPG